MKKLMFLVGAFFLLIATNVYADSASIDIKSSNTSVKPGDYITVTTKVSSSVSIGYYEYTLDYNHNKLKLTSGSSYNVERSNNNSTKSFKKTFKFLVTDEGTSKITVKSYSVTGYSSEKNLDVSVNDVSIKSSLNNDYSSYSTNNYLSSLKVDGEKISPSFDKKTLDYTLELDSDVDEINIVAKALDSKAKVAGDGTFNVTQGDNKFEIIVTSQKGEERVYNLLVTVDDKNPIKVSIDGKDYTVVKNIAGINIPDGYKTKTITIDGTKVTCFYNDITKYTLVGLKDSDSNIELYIYNEDDNSYTLYKQIDFDTIYFIPLETKEKLDDYNKYDVTINGYDISCYRLSSSDNTCLIYGMNAMNGDKGWYLYDGNTIVKYSFDADNYYKEKIDSSNMLIYIAGGSTLLFGIIGIVLAIKLSKRKKRF